MSLNGCNETGYLGQQPQPRGRDTGKAPDRDRGTPALETSGDRIETVCEHHFDGADPAFGQTGEFDRLLPALFYTIL